jgi:hypothetical protein
VSSPPPGTTTRPSTRCPVHGGRARARGQCRLLDQLIPPRRGGALGQPKDPIWWQGKRIDRPHPHPSATTHSCPPSHHCAHGMVCWLRRLHPIAMFSLCRCLRPPLHGTSALPQACPSSHCLPTPRSMTGSQRRRTTLGYKVEEASLPMICCLW